MPKTTFFLQCVAHISLKFNFFQNILAKRYKNLNLKIKVDQNHKILLATWTQKYLIGIKSRQSDSPSS